MQPVRDREPALFLISGIPGAGKSTVAAALARRFDRAAHIDADVLLPMIVSGNAWARRDPPIDPLANPALHDDAVAQLRLRCRHACMLADSFVSAGYTAIIDEIAVGDRLEDFVTDLSTRPLMLVQLAPDLQAVSERNAGRPGKDVFAVWAHLDAELRAMPRRGLWVDSSTMDVEQTVDEIMRRAWTEARID